MTLRLAIFLLTAVVLFSRTNAVAKCNRRNLHACLGGNGKRAAMDASNRDEQLMKILSRGLADQRPTINENDDYKVLPIEKSYDRAVRQNDFSPIIKRLAKIILSEEPQN